MILADEQLVFDTICTEIGKEISPLFVNWSIGRHRDVVTELDARLGIGIDGAVEAVQELIEKGWLTGKPYIASGCSDPDERRLGITHKGWPNWTYFDECYLGDWNFGELAEWLEWDGTSNPNAGLHPEVFQPKDKVTPASYPSVFDPWKPSSE